MSGVAWIISLLKQSEKGAFHRLDHSPIPPALCRPTNRTGAHMIKREVLTVASISGILGIMMGMLGTSWVWLQSNAGFARLGAVAKTETGIETKVALLEQIRSGRYTDATRQLEVLLDTDLVGVAEFTRDGMELSLSTLRALQTELNARRVSGYQPDNATVSANVQEAFRLADGTRAASDAPPDD